MSNSIYILCLDVLNPIESYRIIRKFSQFFASKGMYLRGFSMRHHVFYHARIELHFSFRRQKLSLAEIDVGNTSRLHVFSSKTA